MDRKTAKYAIGIPATKNYTYAMHAQAVQVQANLAYAGIAPEEVVIVLVGDKEIAKFANTYERLLPGCVVDVTSDAGAIEGKENYDKNSQLLIAQLRTAVVARARTYAVEFLWFLDSDVLPPANALRCSLDSLTFDNGYYGVAACLYASQGDGPWLTGRGSYYNRIFSDLLTEERALPERVVDKINKLLLTRDDARKARDHAKHEWAVRRLDLWATWAETHCGPKEDIYGLNSKGRWRRRGWFDFAYPAVGKGAIVPTDWCGFGCTLISARALAMCDWYGYDGGGTEDLFVVWERWFLNGIRIASIPHVLCSHVIRVRGKEGKYVIVEGYHEFEGEYVGHPRKRTRPFYQQTIGEKYLEDNDGVVDHIDNTGSNKRKRVAFQERPANHRARERALVREGRVRKKRAPQGKST